MTHNTDPLLANLARLQRQDQRVPANDTQAQVDIEAAGELPLSDDETDAIVQFMMQPDPSAARPAPEASYGQAQDAQGRASVDPGQRRTRRFLMRAAMATTAGLMVGVAVWLGAMGQSSTVYGQVLAAFDEARTLHVVISEWRDGHWVKSIETWYDRQRGSAETRWRDGQISSVQIDDGKNHWGFDPSGKTVSRHRINDPRRIALEVLDLRRFMADWQRDPTGDQTLAGVPVQMYVGMGPDGQQGRTWVDASMRPLLCQFGTLEAGQFHPRKQGTVEYDGRIDPARFQPNFGKDVQVIDVDSILDERLGLEKAIFRQELLGLIFAVHETKRVEGGGVLVVYSIRPTEETNRDLGPLISRKGAGSKCYGDGQLHWSWKRKADGKTTSYGVGGTELATTTLDGICVCWYLMMPYDKIPAPDDQLQLGASIYTRNELEKKMTAQGQRWYKEFPYLTDLSLPAETLSLRQVVSQTYAETKRLAAIAAWTSLCSGAELTPQKTVTGRTSSPGQISEEQYLQGVQQSLAAIEAMLKADR